MEQISTDPFAQWWEQYRPVGHPQEQSSPYIGDIPRLFGFDGSDMLAVESAYEKNPGTIWTLLECDGSQFVVSGMHRVNRQGYFITEVATGEEFVEIPVDDPEDVLDEYE